MPNIKVRDLVGDYTEIRRALLWATAAQCELMVWKIEISGAGFHMITNNNSLDKLKNESLLDNFVQEGFEVVLPPEARSLRTLVLRDVDLIYRNMKEEDIRVVIEEGNPWIKTEEVVKLPGAKNGFTPLLKVRLNSIAMANRALVNGIKFKHQTLLPKSIEQEVYIKTTLCSNCLSFAHMKKDCPSRELPTCSRCAGQGHKGDRCNKQQIKCTNCSNDHVAYHPQCPERKKHIKKMMTTERKKERNRSKSRHQKYLEKENEPVTHTAPMNIEEMNNVLPMNAMTVIMAAIITASTIAKRKPGTFKTNYDKFCQFNNIPTVAWHPDLIAELLEEDNEGSLAPSSQSCEPNQIMQRKIDAYNMQIDELLDNDSQKTHSSRDIMSGITSRSSSGFHLNLADFDHRDYTEEVEGSQESLEMSESETTVICGLTKRNRHDVEDSETKLSPLGKMLKQQQPLIEEAYDSRTSSKPICMADAADKISEDKTDIRGLGISIRYPKQWGTAMNKGVVVTEVLEGRLMMEYGTQHKYKEIARLLDAGRKRKNLNMNDIEFIPTDAKQIKRIMEDHGMKYDEKNPIYSI